MSKVIAIVGMAGSGKSVVSRVFEEAGFTRIRFGDVTDKEVKAQGLPLNEENERRTREMLRKKHGMEAYAILNQPVIREALEHADVVLDGLYSWEEYDYLKKIYVDKLVLIAVWSSPGTRYRRLKERAHRPLTAAEAAGRDRAEIENLHKGGPIAMADFTIANETSLEYLKSEAKRVIDSLKNS